MQEFFPEKGKSNKSEVFLFFDKIDSTNSWAKRNIDRLDSKRLTLIIANEQLAGRGRFNRQWKSPPHANIYVTFCTFFPQNRADLANLGQLMAVSVAQTLFRFNLRPAIKWPNDLFVSGKKIGGILCELVPYMGNTCLMIGVGLNVNMGLKEIEEAGLEATSMSIELGLELNVQEVIKALYTKFKYNLKTFQEEGFKPFYDLFSYLNFSYHNQKIKFSSQNRQWEGTFQRIDEDGALHLILDDGEVMKFTAGEITN